MANGPYSVNDRRDYYRNTYLKSDHWKWVKSVMLSLYPACQICGTTKRLDVHHRHYRSLYDVTRDDLIVLCRSHHNQVHRPINGIRPTEKEVERQLLEILPLTALTPRERYLKLAFRFFHAAREIELRYGVALKTKARHKVWRHLKKTTLAKAFVTAITPIKSPLKKKRPSKTSAPRYVCICEDRKRFTPLAVRLFTIARKIQREHKIPLLRIAREMIFSHRPDLTRSTRSVWLPTVGDVAQPQRLPTT